MPGSAWLGLISLWPQAVCLHISSSWRRSLFVRALTMNYDAYGLKHVPKERGFYFKASLLSRIHCFKSNLNFSDITWNVEENQILHEIFHVLSRFPRYISCFIAESQLHLGQCSTISVYGSSCNHILNINQSSYFLFIGIPKAGWDAKKYVYGER